MAGFFTAKYLMQTSVGPKEMSRDFFLPDPKSVREEIVQMGGVPLSIKLRQPGFFGREYISGKYKQAFLRSVAFHVQAGMSPGKALWIVIEGESDRAKRIELEPALEVLRRGGNFMVALRELRMFDRSVLAIMSAGERIGALKEVVDSALKHMEEKGKTWKMLTAAVGWLWFDIGSAVSTVIGVQFGYLPWLEENGVESKDPKVVAEFKTALESAYIINSVLLITSLMLCVVGVIVVFSIIARRGWIEEMTSAAIRRLPIIKGFMENTALAETFGIVGRMVKGRVQLDEALKVAADSTPIKHVSQLWTTALQRLARGDTVDRAMRNPILSRSEIIEIGAHQNSDQLGEMFLNISRERAEASKRGLRQIVVGGVAFVILYTFLAAGAAMWVLWVQNKGLSATMQGISGTGSF